MVPPVAAPGRGGRVAPVQLGGCGKARVGYIGVVRADDTAGVDGGGGGVGEGGGGVEEGDFCVRVGGALEEGVRGREAEDAGADDEDV